MQVKADQEFRPKYTKICRHLEDPQIVDSAGSSYETAGLCLADQSTNVTAIEILEESV